MTRIVLRITAFAGGAIHAKSARVPLAFEASRASLGLWGEEKSALAQQLAAASCGPRTAIAVVPPGDPQPVRGAEIRIVAALPVLARTNASAVRELPPSLATWVLAGKQAVDLVAREQIVPTLR